uniref:RNA helicase n=1 Tax=Salarias fasciatus TaxID=181472 RepID=A0A672F3V6_SALFA
MISAVQYILSKMVSPLWRTAEVGRGNHFSGMLDVRHLQDSVVTQLCLDYGMIDDAIYFTKAEVLGGTPLKVGDLVNCTAVRDGSQGGWKALRVEKSADAWEDGGRSSQEKDCEQLRPLIGTITSFDGNDGYINQKTHFPRHSLTEGYEPMKGDWVQAKYFVNPTQWTTHASSVAPLRYCRVDEVPVTSVFGKNGVVNDSVFFTMDSLLLPANYQPLLGDLVNVVILESKQSLYCWRALCMSPCKTRKKLIPLSAQYSSLLNSESLRRRNKGSEVHRLQYCDFAGWDSEEQFALVAVNGAEPPRERKNSSHGNGCHPSTTKIEAGDKNTDMNLGSCTELLVLHFTSFTIERRLEVTVGSESENLLQPSLPYTPSETRPASTLPSHVLTVTAPQGMKRLKNRRLPNFLPKYSVPQALRDCVEADTDVLVVEPRLGEVLSPSNLASRFSTLLWLEELHVEKEVKEFTIYGAVLRKGAGYLHLTVHGLTEGRPNLNLADRLLLKKQLADGAVIEYVCYVMEINEEEVSLRVNSDFERAYLGEPLDVEFCVNRLTMRRCHYALAQAQHFSPQNGVSIDMESKSTQTKDGKLASRAIPSEGHFFNPELNPAQREAVKRILEGECRPTPYVLFGPPGTGKTITLIEAILQVYHFLPSSRVLVCTPSNSAADLIAIRLHESGFLHAASLARINATCRHLESIPEVLRTYSNAGEDVHHAAFHRIVVSTCSSAGMLSTIGLQVGHFTHIFLDEAGQATEPESLIPVGLVSEKNGQVVLAGDPRQLGPVVKSACAEAFGLGVSLLERLMANPLYSRQDWGYNPKLVTKLIYNYRSHETLLTLPSKLFYQGELCFKAPKEITDSLSQWKNLPKKGFPLLFHGVRGTEMREGKNPSRFNPPEAVQVMLYCCQLAKKLYKPVSVSDIGIISPYRKQVSPPICTQNLLLTTKVFAFSIFSSVRSNESELSDDLQSTIGFLANPKRFNVAITRSKALLIVVGNPHILIRDPCFSALLHYTFENGAYLGCDPPLSLRSPRE